MKNFRLLMIVLSLGFATGANASTTNAAPVQGGSVSLAHEAAVAGSSAGVATAAAGKPVVQEFNFPKAEVQPSSLQGRRMSHVPEPEGWAMMLMGVGFVIYQVRRRKRPRASWDLR